MASVTERLAALGFEPMDTGGNCTAHRREVPGGFILVTDHDAECCAATDATAVLDVGWYDDEDGLVDTVRTMDIAALEIYMKAGEP